MSSKVRHGRNGLSTTGFEPGIMEAGAYIVTFSKVPHNFTEPMYPHALTHVIRSVNCSVHRLCWGIKQSRTSFPWLPKNTEFCLSFYMQFVPRYGYKKLQAVEFQEAEIPVIPPTNRWQQMTHPVVSTSTANGCLGGRIAVIGD